MKTSFADLWRPQGTIDRGPYALIGIFGFALKHNLDRVVASYAFHRPWDLFNYWVPVRDVVRITSLGGDEARFLATMVAMALPFIWVGVTLTIKRLRSAGLSPQLALLFFVPFLNLLFFLILCLVPASHAPDRPGTRREPALVRALPEGALGSAAVSLMVTVPVGVGLAILGSQVLANYGWGLFVALPFAMGFTAALLYGARQPRTLKASVGVACLSVSLVGAGLLAVAVEGLVCLIMAAPIALPLAAFGGLCAHRVQQRRWLRGETPAFFALVLLIVPGTQWIEHVTPRPAPLFMVRSSIDIHASPEEVWRQVVAFSEIPAPTEWMFRAGIAYPIRAEIAGRGPGAERHCVFSTGAFVEPIQVWDEPHLLKFSVTSNPPPMEEWTPYRHIEPPHLHGFLESEGGQFLLTRLPDGGTRLEGTTWYHHGLWPSQYWRLWSDAIIHRIHMRVLTHIRAEAERQGE
ncbi:MAG TPA: hypothetical protein VKV39_11185 [Candidatus Sulfotelmatobacter sp.]|nr:hypothetical protein [Candidatus Sulfotelmatobacter sp.]